MTVQKHVHKFRRHTYKKSGSTVFFCTLPDCTFKIDVPLAIGKRCLCNMCDKEFLLNEYAIRLVKPHCNDCSRITIRDENGKRQLVKRPSLTQEMNSSVAVNSNDELRKRLAIVTDMTIDEEL